MPESVNSCDYVMTAWEVSLEDFLSWNPSLVNVDPCYLQPGYRYCTTNDTSSLVYVCEDLAYDFSISEVQLKSWNSWIGSDCDTGLYQDLGETEERYVCVRIGSATGTQVPTTTSSTSAASIGPTQTGIIEDCTAFYTVQDGDSCASIDSEYGITFAQLYAWNPAIGSDCENLWLGYAYCVATQALSTATLTSTTSSSPAAPTMSGTASTCSEYYTISSGDGCWSVQQKFDLDFATLYRWNTGIGSDCENFWLGYSICVAGGPE
ncbi:hypothetical protein QQX98_010293 [Neonectria punicea]|uniref:LysM domain-containing protein n=1 Tax=Neonectria punicea TaxID=979145 RepID=A0ABR1GQD9_9HYPO